MLPKTKLWIGVLLPLATICVAELPPKYLSVKDFRHCLVTQSLGSYQGWCLPKGKPLYCPRNSWKELILLEESGKVIRCQSQ